LADKTDASIIDEVEKRLEDLFGDSEDSPGFETDRTDIEEAPIFEEDRSDIEDTPLEELKSTVLSIDWEITDEIMIRFLEQVDELKIAYKDDKIIQMLLQLLFSVGKYIKAKKASADPDVVKLLNSAYTALEKVLLTEGITGEESKKLLLSEVRKFKKLKERLSAKAAVAGKKDVSPPDKKERAKGDIATPVSEAEEEGKSADTSIIASITRKSKGLGLGSIMALIVLLPLIIVVGAGFVYVSQLTSIPSQINQFLQTLLGVSLEETRTIVLTILSSLIIIIGLIAYLYNVRVAGKIKYLTHVTERISAGDIDTTIEVKGGEIGALAEAIGRMRDCIR